MGKLTNIGRGQRGIDFKRNRNSIWVGLGRTTAWPDESNPIDEVVTATTVEELFGMKLYDEAFLVVEASDGTVVHKGKTYRKLKDSEFPGTVTDLLYVKFTIFPDEFPGIHYRQLGVFVDSIPKEGFSSFSALTGDQFQTLGRLVYLDNFTKVTRYDNTRHEIVVIIQG